MKNTFLFKTGRAAALTSMLGISLLLPFHGIVSTVHGASQPTSLTTSQDDAIAFLEMFWADAWGIDFVHGHSSMVLWESLPGNSWGVIVGDSGARNPVVAEGTFAETSQEFLGYLAWPQDRLDEAGLINVDHYFVGGTVYGSTGFESAVVAMLQEILAPGENPGDPPIVARVLSPFQLAADEDAANEEVSILASLYYATGDICVAIPMPPGGPTPNDGGQGTQNCAAQHELCDDACWDLFIIEEVACGLIGAACVGGCAIFCAGATIGWPLCFALCSGVCLVAEAACAGLAHARYKFCLTQCQIAHMQCDPSYVPPCFKMK